MLVYCLRTYSNQRILHEVEVVQVMYTEVVNMIFSGLGVFYLYVLYKFCSNVGIEAIATVRGGYFYFCKIFY